MATMQDCIKDCLDCHAVCLATIAHCLRKGGASCRARSHTSASGLHADLQHERRLHAARFPAAHLACALASAPASRCAPMIADEICRTTRRWCCASRPAGVAPRAAAKWPAPPARPPNCRCDLGLAQGKEAPALLVEREKLATGEIEMEAVQSKQALAFTLLMKGKLRILVSDERIAASSKAISSP